jgi:hypothetical protein
VPCTGDATKARWLAKPYFEDKTIILCGIETRGSDGVKTKHAKCPRNKAIIGKFDSIPVDEIYDRVERTVCGEYSLVTKHRGSTYNGQVFPFNSLTLIAMYQ